jgi:O-acetyl-ADP-ribose deacetylase (regulator of RNase III)
MAKKHEYIEKNGNLIDMFSQGEFDAIAHGCNCFNTMGAGLAAQISIRYREAMDADNLTTSGDLLKLGSLTLAATDDGVIYNLYTQYQAGKHLDYDALTLSLRKMSKMIKGKDWTIGFPQIGAGIAGGNWNKIKRIILREFAGEKIVFVYFKK